MKAVKEDFFFNEVKKDANYSFLTKKKEERVTTYYSLQYNPH